MAENKFIQRLKGQNTSGALLEIKKDNSKTVFAKMPQGTSDATVAYSDSNNDAIAVLKNAVNWKIIGSNLDLSTSVSGDGDDYTGEAAVSGISDAQGNNLWINSSYTVPEGGMIFTKNTKWILKLCGDNLIENGGDSIGFTVIITLGNSNIISKTFTVREQATFFCKELVIDFSESNDSVIKLAQSDKITLKLLSNSANASARIYQGMTTLTVLQRRVDGDVVSSDSKTFTDIEGDIEDIQEHIIVKSVTMPTASADLLGSVYQYVGDTTSPYEHGFIYECVQSSPGVYNWQRIDVQPGGSRGRFLSLWDCATGLAVTNPPISPYEYKTGDYFIVSNVSASTNYKPDGTQYVIGTASTAVETSAVFVDDTYFFDGTTWKLQNTSNDIKTLLDGKVSTDGSSTMTGVLKMRASVSFQCAIAPYWDGVGFYKLNDNDSVTLMASMEDTLGFIPAGTSVYNIGSSDHKWKDLYVARVITGVLNNGANINVPTVAGTLARVEDINSKITDCVTNIPQDIKLEISSNVITLKAGSKAYLPDGTTYAATQDIVLDNAQFGSATGDWVLAMTADNSIFPRNFANCVSGAGATTVAGYAFNTTTNKIHWFSGGGVEQAADCSFPIAVFHTDSGVPTVIKQIFNGYGFIGSTIFVLPGVTCFGAAGRNADGTVKNYVFTTSQVITNTPSTTNGTIECVIRDNQIQEPSGLVWPINKTAEITAPVAAWYYCLEDNICGVWTPSTQTWSQIGHCVFATVTLSSGKITEFKPKTVFHAVDYNDTDFIAHQAMPSTKSITLTLGASGNTYTALADGYFTVVKSATASNEYLYLRNSTSGLNIGIYPPNGLNGRAYIPVARGDVITISYNLTGPTSEFKFIYANGHE